MPADRHRFRTAEQRDEQEQHCREFAYRAGFLARANEHARDTNPHVDGWDLERAAWWLGWDAADATAKAQGEERLMDVPLGIG